MTKSIMRLNAEKDPSYAPYCLRCSSFSRMSKVEQFYWKCKCGAEHDERDYLDYADEDTCCCGDSMENHSSAWYSGHTPKSMADWVRECAEKESK